MNLILSLLPMRRDYASYGEALQIYHYVMSLDAALKPKVRFPIYSQHSFTWVE